MTQTPSSTPVTASPASAVPGYAAPAYAPAPQRGRSIASLVLGIVSLACGFILVAPIVGLVLGISGLRREPAGRGMAIGGIITNVIALATWLVIGAVLLLAAGATWFGLSIAGLS